MSRENAFEEYKAYQNINQSASANMVRGSSYTPCDEARQYNPINQNLPRNISVKIKKSHTQDKQG